MAEHDICSMRQQTICEDVPGQPTEFPIISELTCSSPANAIYVFPPTTTPARNRVMNVKEAFDVVVSMKPGSDKYRAFLYCTETGKPLLIGMYTAGITGALRSLLYIMCRKAGEKHAEDEARRTAMPPPYAERE